MSNAGTVRDDASLHPQTVTDYSTGELQSRWSYYEGRRRARGGRWNTPTARDQIDPGVLAAALRAAGGDSTRLWFDDDGSVWVLNHRRGETCPSPACPVCSPRG